MQGLEIFADSPAALMALTGVIGLMVGSFLNVVIYRLPIMMQKSWRRECIDYLKSTGDAQFVDLDTGRGEADSKFNLVFPLSRCPHCETPIKPYQNIPVLSYLLLKGRCAQCNAPISKRYPIIEGLTGFFSVLIAWHFSYSVDALFALILTWSLIALSAIDIDHQLLPDSITLPLVWLGLFLSLFDIFIDTHSSIIGAIAGYLSLWTVYHGFKLLTGKEGMGYGDFKLLAMFGAWLGWQYILPIILLSSLVGAVIGIAMVILVKRDKNIPIPFGPYLAAAGWIALLWGDKINQAYLNFAGL
ncbi:MAG TPA: prepilin peptidase [Methylococcaceae bacterium]|nr:prepilin peptidase [Methylococcaceae bacterium]